MINATPLYEKHLRQARENEGLVFFLCNECAKKYFFNWIFVVIYYTALHYFNAFLASKGKRIPNTHRDKSSYELGSINMAKEIFFTNKNCISHGVGDDLGQLLKWSYDVRYDPDKSKLLGNEEIKVALNHLRGIKVVAFNEIEYMPDWDIEREKILIKKVPKSYIKGLYEKFKQEAKSII